MFYTLYAGLFAFVACLMALYLAVSAWFAASNSSRPDAEVRAARMRVVGAGRGAAGGDGRGVVDR